jgi:Tol biopolymer transport system component
LKRDVSTAQRWERREAMPVHRHLHDKLGSVYAFRTELDAWTASRKPHADAGDTPGTSGVDAPVAPRSPARRLAVATAILAVVAAALAAAAVWRLEAADYFWRNPLANAHFQRLTDFEGTEHSAAISRDGKLVAFLSSRDGQVDVWVTQVGTGHFHNATHGKMSQLVNPAVRSVGFSPDGALVSFWVGKSDASSTRQIGTWVVPTLSGEPRPYLEAAEVDWSPDGRRLVYHTSAAGDPMFVKGDDSDARSIFVAPTPQHSHFQTWSPDGSFIYFVQGAVPNEAMDIWRIRPAGGAPERITFHNSRVSHPTLLDPSTLLYLATESDGSGPWIYSMNVERRVPHRISAGVERYTSLAASGDGHRLVATAAHLRTSLWRVPLSALPAAAADARRITLPTADGRLPRLARDYLLYVASNGVTESIWKLVEGAATELWTAPAARIVGAPAITADGKRIAFSFEERGQTRLVVMNADGSGSRAVGGSLDLRGAPAWSPDGHSIVMAVNESGKPRLFRISLDTRAPVRVLDDYSLDPAWAPEGRFLVYSGMDIGTTFPVKTVSSAGRPSTVPGMTLSRGARRFRFLPGQATLVILRGDVDHKELWAIDLKTGGERQLTNFGPDVRISDFDVSPDGREIVFERTQEDSDVVLIDRPKP